MRKSIIFIVLIGILSALLIARSKLPDPSAVAVMGEGKPVSFNILDLTLPAVTETAGSAMIEEMNAYFSSLAPTERNPWTGVFRGKNLILVSCSEWAPDPQNKAENPALYRLARESAEITQVWRPDWYQGADGSLFALLSGLMPTRVYDESALQYAGSRNIYLPFALPRSFSRQGYASIAFIRDEAQSAALTALGFADVRTGVGSAESAEAVSAALDSSDGPVFAFCQWSGSENEALSALMEVLSGDHWSDTVLCFLTADKDPERAQLYLRGAGLSGASSDDPCSELDLPPTLLNLFGIAFDSRLLSGRDIFAGNGTPLVSLYGSAFSAWVTDKGRYDPASDSFLPSDGALFPGDPSDYVQRIVEMTYRRYIFARRVMENNYFHLIFGGKE